jgi:hypothetical protein
MKENKPEGCCYTIVYVCVTMKENKHEGCCYTIRVRDNGGK